MCDLVTHFYSLHPSICISDLSNGSAKSCFIWLETLPPGEPPPGQPKKMVPIAVSKGSKDVGPQDGGEHYHHDENLIVFRITEDWVIDPKNKNEILVSTCSDQMSSS